jgi:predicted dehydrogenase
MTSVRLDFPGITSNIVPDETSIDKPTLKERFRMQLPYRRSASRGLKQLFLSRWCYLACVLSAVAATAASGQSAHPAANGKVRFAIVGLDHDHVWGILKDIAGEKSAELVAIAENDPALVSRAKGRVPASVGFFDDFIKMLDEVKPDAVIATTSNDRHLQILRECARRHIHFSTEKPMATNAADAREMLRLADAAGIKLMVNYWNAWVPPTPAMSEQVRSGVVGPVQKIIVEYGHAGPKEIGVSQQFAAWLYDPQKNGGGAIMDFGCYGAEWAIWLKGMPTRVFATATKLKVAQNNQVDDDATMVLDYPDGVAILQASWDWPYGMDRVHVFGPKGSLLATGEELRFRDAKDHRQEAGPEGKTIKLDPLRPEANNPVSYFVDCILRDKPVKDPVSAELNVHVLEVLDAARQSLRSGRAEEIKHGSK